MLVTDRVREFVRQHNLIVPGSRVLAAVSGGSDSVALVRILRSLADAGELDLAGVAHFNHQLRESADDDERFVFQGVHMILDGDHQRPWGADEKRLSRIVFIGRNLDQDKIRKGFESCIA